MNRTAFFVFAATAALLADTDPTTLIGALKRGLSESDKQIVNVSVSQQSPAAPGVTIVDTEVTRKEQYLVWGTDAPLRLLGEWKMDAAREWLVSTNGNGLMAYDFVGGYLVPIQTRLPVAELLEISDRKKGLVTVRLIDRAIEEYPLNREKP